MLDQTFSSEFEVQQIVDEKIIDSETHYLVKWIGYGHEENTWEPMRHMTHSKAKVQEWQQYKIRQLRCLGSQKGVDDIDLRGENRNTLFKSAQLKNSSQKVSNPYKKVLKDAKNIQLELQDQDGNEKGLIKNLFDKPEIKRLSKTNKVQRKKKQLQLFQKRLKSRPKVWQQYLVDEDEAVKRATQQIKQVIDRVYGSNQIQSSSKMASEIPRQKDEHNSDKDITVYRKLKGLTGKEIGSQLGCELGESFIGQKGRKKSREISNLKEGILFETEQKQKNTQTDAKQKDSDKVFKNINSNKRLKQYKPKTLLQLKTQLYGLEQSSSQIEFSYSDADSDQETNFISKKDATKRSKQQSSKAVQENKASSGGLRQPTEGTGFLRKDDLSRNYLSQNDLSNKNKVDLLASIRPQQILLQKGRLPPPKFEQKEGQCDIKNSKKQLGKIQIEQINKRQQIPLKIQEEPSRKDQKPAQIVNRIGLRNNMSLQIEIQTVKLTTQKVSKLLQSIRNKRQKQRQFRPQLIELQGNGKSGQKEDTSQRQSEKLQIPEDQISSQCQEERSLGWKRCSDHMLIQNQGQGQKNFKIMPKEEVQDVMLQPKSKNAGEIVVQIDMLSKQINKLHDSKQDVQDNGYCTSNSNQIGDCDKIPNKIKSLTPTKQINSKLIDQQKDLTHKQRLQKESVVVINEQTLTNKQNLSAHLLHLTNVKDEQCKIIHQGDTNRQNLENIYYAGNINCVQKAKNEEVILSKGHSITKQHPKCQQISAEIPFDCSISTIDEVDTQGHFEENSKLLKFKSGLNKLNSHQQALPSYMLSRNSNQISYSKRKNDHSSIDLVYNINSQGKITEKDSQTNKNFKNVQNKVIDYIQSVSVNSPHNSQPNYSSLTNHISTTLPPTSNAPSSNNASSNATRMQNHENTQLNNLMANYPFLNNRPSDQLNLNRIHQNSLHNLNPQQNQFQIEMQLQQSLSTRATLNTVNSNFVVYSMGNNRTDYLAQENLHENSNRLYQQNQDYPNNANQPFSTMQQSQNIRSIIKTNGEQIRHKRCHNKSLTENSNSDKSYQSQHQNYQSSQQLQAHTQHPRSSPSQNDFDFKKRKQSWHNCHEYKKLSPKKSKLPKLKQQNLQTISLEKLLQYVTEQSYQAKSQDVMYDWGKNPYNEGRQARFDIEQQEKGQYQSGNIQGSAVSKQQKALNLLQPRLNRVTIDLIQDEGKQNDLKLALPLRSKQDETPSQIKKVIRISSKLTNNKSKLQSGSENEQAYSISSEQQFQQSSRQQNIQPVKDQNHPFLVCDSDPQFRADRLEGQKFQSSETQNNIKVQESSDQNLLLINDLTQEEYE